MTKTGKLTKISEFILGAWYDWLDGKGRSMGRFKCVELHHATAHDGEKVVFWNQAHGHFGKFDYKNHFRKIEFTDEREK